MNPLNVFTIVGVVQSLFSGIILLTIDRNNKTANKILAFLILFIGLSIAPLMFTDGGKPPIVASVLRAIPDVRFLFGPLLYFYARALVARRFRFRGRHLLHALPFYINAVVSMYFRYSSFQIWLSLRTPLAFLCYAHVLLYSTLTIVLIGDHLRSIKASFSSIRNRSLSWLVYLTAAFIAVFCFMTLLEALHAAGIGGAVVDARDRLTAVLVTVFVFSVGFFGLRQPEIFSRTADGQEPKYGGSSLSDDEVEELHARLEAFMRERKPYLDGELTIEKLAGLCGIPDYHLSRVINQKAGMIFYDYINAYRIKEVQELMNDPGNDRYTILGLAMDAGFNSKSAFYASFRKFPAMTPVEYKRSVRKPG